MIPMVWFQVAIKIFEQDDGAHGLSGLVVLGGGDSGHAWMIL